MSEMLIKSHLSPEAKVQTHIEFVSHRWSVRIGTTSIIAMPVSSMLQSEPLSSKYN